MHTTPLHILGLTAVLAAPALAQPFAITWSTIDAGGTTAPMAGGTYTLAGTAGQPDAGAAAAGSFACLGGFWGVAAGAACYANCDNSTITPILNVQDFACFLNRFASADPYANCDQSTTSPVLNVQDFACFLNAFATGCP